MKAMVLAAGMGTRLQPYTLTKPKALVEINGIPLLEIILKRLKKFGFTDIVINVHHFADQIIDFIKRNNQFDINIQFSDERELLLDTGGGLLNARELLNDGEPILIHNVDILTNIDLKAFYQFHIDQKSLVSLAVKHRKTSRSLLINQDMQLCGWRNNLTGHTIVSKGNVENLNDVAFSAVHIISNDLFNLITERGVFSIIQTYLRLAKDYSIMTMLHDDDFWMDVGQSENLKEAVQYLPIL